MCFYRKQKNIIDIVEIVVFIFSFFVFMFLLVISNKTLESCQPLDDMTMMHEDAMGNWAVGIISSLLLLLLRVVSFV